MPRPTRPACARLLAGLYAALAAANCAAAAKRHRSAEWATKPLLMPVLAGFALAAADGREEDMRLPAAGLALSGLGDTAQESAVMPTYVTAQFLLAAGFLRPQDGTAKP